jgi:hypothetical protein
MFRAQISCGLRIPRIRGPCGNWRWTGPLGGLGIGVESGGSRVGVETGSGIGVERGESDFICCHLSGNEQTRCIGHNESVIFCLTVPRLVGSVSIWLSLSCRKNCRVCLCHRVTPCGAVCVCSPSLWNAIPWECTFFDYWLTTPCELGFDYLPTIFQVS